MDTALERLNEMVAQGFRADTREVNAILKACKQRSQVAKELFEAWKSCAFRCFGFKSSIYGFEDMSNLGPIYLLRGSNAHLAPPARRPYGALFEAGLGARRGRDREGGASEPSNQHEIKRNRAL